eukprot:3343169-Amphidinium_carterae.1
MDAGLTDRHGISDLLAGLDELRSGLFRCNAAAEAFRVLGRAVDCLPRQKLRLYLESAEGILCLVRDNTDWKAKTTEAPLPLQGKHVFGLDEARRTPAAILRNLRELCNLAEAKSVK